MKQISFSKNLTDKQSKFVDYFVAEGKTQTEAARLAGYSFPEYEGYRLVRQPRMIQVIHAARQKYYQTNLANVAVSTLQQVMQDQNAPPAARVSAARTALELAGDLGPNSVNGSEGGSLCEMTPGELSRLIDRWEDERISMTKDITPVSSDTPPPPGIVLRRYLNLITSVPTKILYFGILFIPISCPKMRT